MTPKPQRSVLSVFLAVYARFATLAAGFVLLSGPIALASVGTTTTSLSVSATSVPYKTPVTLTATVQSNGSPVTSGLVLFCDASAKYCENNSALGIAQLTFPGATAVVKLGSGPLGDHSYKAVYRPNSSYAGSTSNTVTYTVTGTYSSSTSITATGTVGNYTLQATVVGIGSLTTGPGGSVSFLDTSAGNNNIATQPLLPATLSQSFAEAKGSPFAIGTTPTSHRSVTIASAYLSSDNNLDVVTGDSQQTITVLLGNGDGTFKPKINYPGCPTGLALKILLSDFNRDGKTDIALACSSTNNATVNGSLTILLGNGDGSFQAPVSYTAGDVNDIALGDFNGDGLIDIVLTNHNQQQVVLFTGKGDGTFSPGAVALTTSSPTNGIVAADFNQDGVDDIAFAINTAAAGSKLSDLYVALGNNDGSFQKPTLVGSQVGEFLTSGDTNADNLPDIVSSSIQLVPNVGPSLFVSIGNGDGTFQTPVIYTSDIPSDPHLADVNGDGKPDIIAGGSVGALVYLGNGDGTFQPYTEPTIGDFALTYAVNAGDYNNDGNADLIGTDAQSPRAAVSLSEVRQTAQTAALTNVAVFPLGSGTHQINGAYSGDSIYAPSTSSTSPLIAAPTPTTLNLNVVPSSATLAGQSITLTATLSPFSVGPPNTTTDTEIIKFFNGSTQIGTGTLSKGVATLTTTQLPAGSDALTAVYPGDANYNTSTSSVMTVTVSNILVTSSLNPSSFGQTVTFTATVVAGATGSVSFKDGSTVLGNGTVANGVATLTTSTLAVGTHDITGVYSGDAGHPTATSPVLSQEVDKATPTLTVATSGPSTYGDTITITTSLPPGTTGTVTVTSGGVTLGSGTVSPSGTVTITTSSLPSGTDTITATYPGDSNNNPATGTTTQTVAKATPVLPAPVATPSSPVVGTPVTLTESIPSGVSGPVSFYNGTTLLGNAPVVSGTASLTVSNLAVGATSVTATTPGDANHNPATSPATSVTIVKASPTVAVTTSGPSSYGSPVTITATVPPGTTGTVSFSNGSLSLGSGTVNSSGVATITTSALPAGSDVVTANYGGDANNNPAAGTATQTVSKATPPVTVTTSGPSTYGGPVTITASVPPGTTGTVTLTSGGVTIGSGTVSPGGTVTVTTSSLPAGSDPITASYGGDSNNSPSTGVVTQTVSKASPSSIISSSANPATPGTPVTFTDTLPTSISGTITFTSGSTVLGTSPIVNGVATLTTSTLPLGSDPVTATFAGDANNNSSVATLTQTIAKTDPTITVVSSGPSVYGNTVTITTTVPPGTTGTVTLSSGGVTLGSGTVSPSGTVVITTSALPVGSDTITASYGGDTTNNPVSGTVTQIVSKTTPISTLTSSLNPATPGTPVTFTDTLPASLSGSVTFTSGGTVIGSATIVNGVANITTSSLPLGSDPVTATFAGDANNNASVATLTQLINKNSPSLTVVTSGPSNYGNTVTLTTAVPPGTTGTVTLTSGGVTVGSGTISPGGTVVITTSSLPVGSDTITATYGGDSTNNPATGSVTQTVSKTSPTSTLTSSLNPANPGTPVTFTDTLPPSINGTVTFTSGSTVLGSSTIVNGVATLTTSSLPLGSDPITATFAGDTNNNGSVATLTQTISKNSPSLIVSTSGPSTYGSPVTITAGVPPGANGTITLTSGGVTLGSGTVSPSGTVVVTTTALPAGSPVITASYSGDSTNNPSTASTTQSVSKITSTLSLSSSANPSSPGQPVTFTATVPAGASGSITFLDGGTSIGTGVIVNGFAVLTTTTLAPGSHTVTAVYTGDSNYTAATSASLNQNVNKSAPTLPPPTASTTSSTIGSPITISEIVPAGVGGPVSFYNGATLIGTAPIVNGVATITTSTLPLGTNPVSASTPGEASNLPAQSPSLPVNVGKANPGISLTSSATPSSTTQPVTFTAAVPAGVTGTITFYDGSTALGTATIANGIATLTTSTLSAGTHPVTATYPGDANTNPAVSNSLSQVVNKTTPVLPTPVLSSSTLTAGTPETITESVPPTVTGIVSFFSGSDLLGTGTVVNGVATLTVPSLPVGTASITAAVAATALTNAATSPAAIATVTKTTLQLAPPTVSTTSAPAGTPVILSETVPTGVTGTVSFYNGPTLVGTAPVINGTATLTTTSLPVGTDPITAVIPATATSNAGTSPAVPISIAKAVATVSLVSSANPSSVNQSVTFTATVPSTATGTVTFFNGSVLLGTAPVNSAGVATLTTASLPVGSQTITATYAGDSNFSAATSPALTQAVSKAPTTITLTESTSAQLLNSTVTFTANVAATTPSPTGSVTFLDGTAIIATAPVSPSGNVVVSLSTTGTSAFTTSSLSTGSHTITAVYSGDSNFTQSTSGPVTNLVEDFTNVNTGAATQNIFPGAVTSYTFKLSPVGSSTFVSNLTLTVDGLPPGTVYTFSPASIAAGAAETSVVLNVQTSTSLNASNRNQPRTTGTGGIPIALGVLGLIGLGATRKRRQSIPRLLTLLLLAAASLLPIGALSGCAGGYFALTPTTYNISVTGTEGNIHHTATATLVVQ